jgi:integrase
LPMILSREEASRLIEAAKTLKQRTALSVAYGAGLRVSEVIALKVSDIDSQRMLLRVEQGKGGDCPKFCVIGPYFPLEGCHGDQERDCRRAA